MARRILVTGGAGFIGSHVVDAFLADGCQVSVIDDLSSGRREQVPQGAEFHHTDIGSADAARLVRERRFDVICHLAAQIDVRKSVADPAADAGKNILGSLNLLEAVRQSGAEDGSGGVRTRFIFSSTGGAVYGDLVEPPTGETASKDPQSPYGTAKLSVEYYMGYYARVHGLDTVALRYANVYGPRQDPFGEAGVVAIFCNRLIDGKPLTIFGDGLQTRDYVFAGDVARANFLASKAELPAPAGVDSRAFNVGTSVETNVVELAEQLREVSGKSAATIEHAPARAGEQRRSGVDISKSARVLGWEPRVSLAEGLGRTYEWFVSLRAEARA
jgi:UDP-glucose 4-epimerase